MPVQPVSSKSFRARLRTTISSRSSKSERTAVHALLWGILAELRCQAVPVEEPRPSTTSPSPAALHQDCPFKTPSSATHPARTLRLCRPYPAAGEAGWKARPSSHWMSRRPRPARFSSAPACRACDPFSPHENWLLQELPWLLRRWTADKARGRRSSFDSACALAAQASDHRFRDVELTITAQHGPSSWDALVELSGDAPIVRRAPLRTTGEVEFRRGDRLRVLDAACRRHARNDQRGICCYVDPLSTFLIACSAVVGARFIARQTAGHRVTPAQSLTPRPPSNG